MFSFVNRRIVVTGDLDGVAVEVGAGAPLPGGGYGGTGYVVFTGTAPACAGGPGTFAWTDRMTQSGDCTTTASWEIIEGSGTG